MKTWQKVLIPTLVTSLIVGGYLFFVFKAREESNAAIKKGDEPRRPTQDELAVVMQYYFTTFDDAKRIEGKNVWVKAGYSLPYYSYSGGQVQFSKRVGELPGAEKLAVSKLTKAVAPAKEDNRVPHGSRQYFAIFTLAGPDAKPGTFAAPIGYAEGGNETLFCDLLFYYDDPKTIFDNWPAPVWDAIAKHTPTVGMTENQARMAAGILIESDSKTLGDRTVTYHSGSKAWTVTFAKGFATQVKEGQQQG